VLVADRELEGWLLGRDIVGYGNAAMSLEADLFGGRGISRLQRPDEDAQPA
jgi:hypothetical protein